MVWWHYWYATLQARNEQDVLLVHHAELVANPIKEVGRVATYLGLCTDDAMLKKVSAQPLLQLFHRPQYQRNGRCRMQPAKSSVSQQAHRIERRALSRRRQKQLCTWHEESILLREMTSGLLPAECSHTITYSCHATMHTCRHCMQLVINLVVLSVDFPLGLMALSSLQFNCIDRHPMNCTAVEMLAL